MTSALHRASAIMASGTMVSRVLGFVKTFLLAFAIGGVVSESGDAFANGNQLPNTVYMLLAGGMLNAVLVPQIVKAARNPDGGKAYINKVLTLVSVVLVALTSLVMLAAPAVVWIFTVTWETDQRALAIAFAYWCIPQIVFYGLYTVLGEVLNAKKIFGPFTWSPALANVVAIIGLVVFIVLFGPDPDGLRAVTDWTPMSIAVLAGSATLGVVAQALILILPWRKAGLSFRPDFKWRGVGLGQTGRIAGWGLATVVVMNLAGIVTSNVINSASGEGVALIAMQNAWLVFMLPHSVIAVSLITAYFTQLSEFGQSGQRDAFRESFSSAARQIFMLMTLAGAMVFMAARHIARVLLLDASESLVNDFAAVLQAYSIGLVAYSLMFVAQRAFYALSDARTPFIFMSAQLVALVVFTLIAMFTIDKSILGVVYAFIWSATTIAQMFYAFWLLKRKIGHFGGTELVASGVRYLIAIVPTIIVAFVVLYVFNVTLPETRGVADIVWAIAEALVLAGVMAIVYLGVLVLLKSPEAKAIVAKVVRR